MHSTIRARKVGRRRWVSQSGCRTGRPTRPRTDPKTAGDIRRWVRNFHLSRLASESFRIPSLFQNLCYGLREPSSVGDATHVVRVLGIRYVHRIAVITVARFNIVIHNLGGGDKVVNKNRDGIKGATGIDLQDKKILVLPLNKNRYPCSFFTSGQQ